MPEPSMAELRRRKAYTLAKELRLNRQARLDLAEYLLRRDITTWRSLDDAQISRLLDALEGYQLISHLRSEQLDDPIVAEHPRSDPVE